MGGGSGPEFKVIFYQEILPELRARGKTVFVISHDQRYYDVADRVIKLDDGWMIENVRQKAGSTAAGQSASSVVSSVHNADIP